MVVVAVGASGAVGCASTVTIVAEEIQVRSLVLLTRILWAPAAIAANVTEDCQVPPSILY